MFKGDTTPVQTTIPKATKKDTTKYLFDGKLYCKRRIAFECVKKYVCDNRVNSYDELINVFPDYLQGSLGIIKPVEIAEKYSNAHRRLLYFDFSDPESWKRPEAKNV